jgi:hypothetical protein
VLHFSRHDSCTVPLVSTLAKLGILGYAAMPPPFFESSPPITLAINKESRRETLRHYQTFKRESGSFRVAPLWIGLEDRPYIHGAALLQSGLVKAVFHTINDGARQFMNNVEYFSITEISTMDLNHMMTAICKS